MAVQKQSFPSFASIISVLSVVFYCVGFIRIELELNQHKKRLNDLESFPDKKPVSNQPADAKSIKISPDIQSLRNNRNKRNLKNETEDLRKVETIARINKLLLQLCHSKDSICRSGPPGPTGPPGRKGNRGRRGQKGKTGNKGDRGIMGSPGKRGKQGSIGSMGLKGETGTKGQKGERGDKGIPGTKGEPGPSISSPTVVASPATLTVNEGKSASFQCSASGYPEPAMMWSKLGNKSEINKSAASGGKLQLQNVTGNDSGSYQCTATNILGKDRAVVQLEVNVRPRVFLHHGPLHAIEGSDVTLPTCHVTGHPQPAVTWSKSFGQLPHGRVQFNSSVIKFLDVRKSDSDIYLCTARNLLGSVLKRTYLVVVSLPQFTVRPPGKVFAVSGDTLTLNCSATGDPQPVLSWKRQGVQLPEGRSLVTNQALILRNMRKEDAGIYICVATSAGVFPIETISDVEVRPLLIDCSDLLKSGHAQSGVYSVNPDGKGHFDVYCDMRTDGGGWTVFQRRQNGSVDFYRGWSDYKVGFGQLTGEFWLGNDKIHRLTASRSRSLRIELEDWNGNKAYAKYGSFNIGDEQVQYRLVLGSYSGTAGDSLLFHNNMAFTTKDRDNDRSSDNCAISSTGAWWYGNCQHSNLNGIYLGNSENDWRGIRWYKWYKNNLSVKFAEMKIRPTS